MNELSVQTRRPTSAWKWRVCCLLFLATAVNYMDRQTLSQTAKYIKDELHLNNEQYGNVEFAFGIAFAMGSITVGCMVDRWNVAWVYPAILFGWSMAGLATGLVKSYEGLLFCRALLGFCEAGNWPCALRTTQKILAPGERTLGNSILQSGTAVGAIVTPLIVQQLVDAPGTWPRPFLVIGATGTIWILLWFAFLTPSDLRLEPDQGKAEAKRTSDSIFGVYLDVRFWVCAVLVVSVNLTWHFFRVWMPLFLIEGHDYSPRQVNYFSSAYYLSADIGSLAAGFASIYLVKTGMGVHRSRVLVFAAFTCLTCISPIIGTMESGWPLLALLLLLGFGSLGIYPPYYSLSQEMSVRHQGKVSGSLGFITWVASAIMQPLVGRWIDKTHDYSAPVALAGLVPLVGLAALVLLWRQPRTPTPSDKSERDPSRVARP